MVVAIVLILIALLGVSLAFGKRYGAIWGVFGSFVALLSAAVIFAESQSEPSKPGKPLTATKRLQPISKKFPLSKPASWEQIKLEAQLRGYKYFFSLGPPEEEDYQLRLDLNKTSGQFQLGYLGPKARKNFSVNNPSFDFLIASDRYLPKIVKSIAQAAGEKIVTADYELYLPAPGALRDDVFFAANKERDLLATIVTIDSERLEVLRQKLQTSAADAPAGE